jgi:hypothetical protein
MGHSIQGFPNPEMSLKLLASFAKEQERRRKMSGSSNLSCTRSLPSACRQLEEEIAHFAGCPVQPA